MALHTASVTVTGIMAVYASHRFSAFGVSTRTRNLSIHSTPPMSTPYTALASRVCRSMAGVWNKPSSPFPRKGICSTAPARGARYQNPGRKKNTAP